jgi:cytochrome P450 family 103
MMTVVQNSTKPGPAGGVSFPVVTLKELEADPHGTFRKYRKDHAVVVHETAGYFVLRAADIDRIAKDPRVGASGTSFPEALGISSGAIFDLFTYSMITAEGEVHRRRRAPFSRLLAARAINDIRQSIRRTADDLIDEWHGRGKVDYFAEFAAPMPARIISDLLGLPREEIPQFTKVVYEVTKIFNFGLKPEEITGIETAVRQLRDYVNKAIEDRRRDPRNDFLSGFLATAKETGDLSPEEVIYQIVPLIFGGADTTRVATAMQLALLLQHRDQWHDVCRNSMLVPAAVSEAMRFEPSGAGTVRLAREDIPVDGGIIPAGQLVVLSMMSGMRDEAVHRDPDRFDIHRTDQPRYHPIFGFGVHRCIGEALARAELEESLNAIIARIPQVQLDAMPEIKGHYGVRRIDAEMPIHWKL